MLINDEVTKFAKENPGALFSIHVSSGSYGNDYDMICTYSDLGQIDTYQYFMTGTPRGVTEMFYDGEDVLVYQNNDRQKWQEWRKKWYKKR